MNQPAKSTDPVSVMPVRRDLRFDLPVERATDWHGQGSQVSHFFNALSLLFPAGERFSWIRCATIATGSTIRC